MLSKIILACMATSTAINTGKICKKGEDCLENNGINTVQDILSVAQRNISSGASLSLSDILIALCSSLVCSLIIAMVYRSTYQGVMYQKSFAISIVLAALITTSVIMVISGNLVLSLGMVGALSIVRFRSAVKDPLDIIYMFWSISIGIANGVANLKVSIAATIIIAIVMVLLTKLPQPLPTKMLIVRTKPRSETDILAEINKSGKKFKLKSRSQKNDYVELIGEIKLKEDDPLIATISSIDSEIETNIITITSNLLDV